MQIVKTILYLLSGLVLALGLVLGVSLIAGTSAIVENIRLSTLLLGNVAITNLITPMIRSLLINLGIAVLILSLILSLLLFAAGRLTGHIDQLEARLARLEAGRV